MVEFMFLILLGKFTKITSKLSISIQVQ